MLLYCIRHGESTFNAEGRVQGNVDVPLSELGRRQAAAVAAACKSLSADAIFSSPLLRARQTADAIAAVLGMKVIEVPGLIEIKVGIFEGHLREELERDCPDEFAQWLSGDPDYVVPGGESRRTLMQRGRAVLESIAEQNYKRAIIVSHGTILAAAFKALLKIPAELNPFTLENASLSRLELDGPRATLHALNEVAHLAGVGLAGRGDL